MGETLIRNITLAAAVIVAAAFGSGEVRAASPGYCAHYAQLAVWQFRRSRACFGTVNAMWNPAYRIHYGWCLGAAEWVARREDARRGAALHACGY